MTNLLVRTIVISSLAIWMMPSPASAQTVHGNNARSAAERMLEPGPEQAQLAGLVGTYEVTATMWPAAGKSPIVTTGLIAQRTMIGPYLQEIMQPAAGSAAPDFRRLDYLSFDRIEGRWKYVSMDTRFPVSIMPASSFGRADGTVLRLLFQPQGFVGFGPDVEGRFMLSDLTISDWGTSRERKEQRVNLATGDAEPWVFVRYEYRRRP